LKCVGGKKPQVGGIPLKFSGIIVLFSGIHASVGGITALVGGIEFPTFRLIRKNRLAIAFRKFYNENNLSRNGGGDEMNRSIFARLLWLEALNIYRAIFHGVVFKGGSLPFFQNYKMNIER
jgi:hypothetical protein